MHQFLRGEDFKGQFLDFLRNEDRRNNFMTMARIQPCSRKLLVILAIIVEKKYGLEI